MEKICEGWIVLLTGERLYYRKVFKRGNCWVFLDYPKWPQKDPEEWSFEYNETLAILKYP